MSSQLPETKSSRITKKTIILSMDFVQYLIPLNERGVFHKKLGEVWYSGTSRWREWRTLGAGHRVDSDEWTKEVTFDWHFMYRCILAFHQKEGFLFFFLLTQGRSPLSGFEICWFSSCLVVFLVYLCICFLDVLPDVRFVVALYCIFWLLRNMGAFWVINKVFPGNSYR